MALCRIGAMSNLPNPTPFSAAPNTHTRLPWKPSLPFKKPSISGFNPGLPYYSNLTIRFASSGETSSFTSEYVKEDPDGSVAESVQTEIPKQEDSVASYNEASNGEDSLDFQAQLSKIFDQLGLEFDSSSIYLYGGGAILALWLTSAIIGAIDSIPLLSKLMELVGLGYTVWFTIRYLLFKRTREEIAAKIKDIKQEVLG